MVAQESLELFVMVRIHAGQPVLLRKMGVLKIPALRLSVGSGLTGRGFVGYEQAGQTAQFSVPLNVNLAVFNLLPLLPLDGGKIVMGLLRKIHQPLRRLEVPLTVGG